MSDFITIRGFVATEIKSSTTPGGVATASFRLGSTTRRLDKESNTWVDGQTNWYNVQCYRQLAGNIGCSIRKGQPVIVTGKLKLRSWEREGRVYHSTEIDADAVGHDLMWGSANFIRTAAKPVLSLVEHDASSNTGHQPGPDGELGEPEDPEDAQADVDDVPAVLIQDNDGGLATLDLETGELAESRV